MAEVEFGVSSVWIDQISKEKFNKKAIFKDPGEWRDIWESPTTCIFSGSV